MTHTKEPPDYPGWFTNASTAPKNLNVYVEGSKPVPANEFQWSHESNRTPRYFLLDGGGVTLFG
jgi:hypothetical protein